MALTSAAKTALQAKRDAAATKKTAALSRGSGPEAAAAERERQDTLRMAEHNWDTLS